MAKAVHLETLADPTAAEPQPLGVPPTPTERFPGATRTMDQKPPLHVLLAGPRGCCAGKWRLALLEPRSLWARIRLSARGSVQSAPAESRDFEPRTWRGGLEHLGYPSAETEMDALANL
jgi:hypothetical protein